MANNLTDLLQQTTRDRYLIEYVTLSDDELRQIVLDNAKKAISLPSTASSLTALAEINGESQACNMILESRAKKRAAIKEGKENWNKQLQERKEEAILSLPAASSSRGQLITAILEDQDGCTAEEIADFCEELSDLPEEEMQALLKELTKEGVIYPLDGRYHLLDICTETLYPEDPVKWGREKYFKSCEALGKSAEDVGKISCILYFLDSCDSDDKKIKPFSAEEISDEIETWREYDWFEPEEHGGSFTKADMDDCIGRCGSYLMDMQAMGILDRAYFENTPFFYYHLCGTKAPNPYVRSIRNRHITEEGKGMTLTRRENLGFKDCIIEAMQGSEEAMTIEEIRDTTPEISGLSNQRVSALVRNLVSDGLLVREERKRKAYYSLSPAAREQLETPSAQ